LLAERRGSAVAQESGFTSLPIDPRRIAAAKGIGVEGKNLTGCYGCFIHHDGMFAIAYSTNLANEGMVNFTIAHELGHYFLDGHAMELFPGGNGVHQSSGPFQSHDPREREADRFAAGLLLPEMLFRRAIDEHEGGLTGIKELQALCVTSLTATAIRYATVAENPVAVIVSRNGCVEYSFLSESLQDVRGLEWLKKGSSIPRDSVSAALAADQSRVEAADSAEAWSTFDRWFDGAPECECREDAVGLGKFGQTLTILWSDESFPDDDDDF
jgi:hypothetical protein